MKAEEALGLPLTEIFTEKALHAIRNRVTLLRGPDAVERMFNLPLVEGGARRSTSHCISPAIRSGSRPNRPHKEEMEASAHGTRHDGAAVAEQQYGGRLSCERARARCGP